MFRYWTSEQRQRLDTVTSLAEAGELAVEVLTGMKRSEQAIVQVCGPMSTGGLGSLEGNMERFARAITVLEERDYLVFNQIPFQEAIVRLTYHHAGGAYRIDILEVFYRRIFECGLVNRTFFLPDWESSTGARWEREFAGAIGIPIENFPHEWLADFK